MTNSDTPETDAACDGIYSQGVARIPLASFMEIMEKLERERDRAEDALRDIALFLNCGGYNDVGLVEFDPAHYAKKIKDAIIMQQRSDRGETNPCIGRWVTSDGPMGPRYQ